MGRNNQSTILTKSATPSAATATASAAHKAALHGAATGPAMARASVAAVIGPASAKTALIGNKATAAAKYIPPPLRNNAAGTTKSTAKPAPPALTPLSPTSRARSNHGRSLSPKEKRIQTAPTWRPTNNAGKLERMFSGRSASAGPRTSLAMRVTVRGGAPVLGATPVREHPDDAFFSGAWLFDTARVPLWMQLAVPDLASALVVRRRMLVRACPNPRYASRDVPALKSTVKKPMRVFPGIKVKELAAAPNTAGGSKRSAKAQR
ncbi:hypothetical protein H9P43_000615 [Blastocladiella emersonii ATCC 22665]|nr:hypothetical protein H9P43_000615 [Blastocladiella emersonii ATCC 22665]